MNVALARGEPRSVEDADKQAYRAMIQAQSGAVLGTAEQEAVGASAKSDDR